jgi:histone acetyltransferase (RNA polymerase elongator complex component)
MKTVAGQNNVIGMNTEADIQAASNQYSVLRRQPLAANPRPFIVPVFLPNLGCPHRCVFCNQAAITGPNKNKPTPEKISNFIDMFLKYRVKKRAPVQLAFYGGNFLGLQPDYIQSLLETAGQFVTAGRIDSIRLSTRPDTIDPQRLDLIRKAPVLTIELGVQSMDNQILALTQRGHTSLDTENAVELLKKRGYEIGLQMMVGLPGDDKNKTFATGRRIAELSPDFVRIYPTVVLENSLLAKWYRQGKYLPETLESSVRIVKELYLFFRDNNIPVIRMGLQVSEDFDKSPTILAGPYHPSFGHLVHSEIFLDKARSLLDSRRLHHDMVIIKVHPRSVSKMRGLRNQNIKTLKREYKLRSIKVVSDSSLLSDRLVFEQAAMVDGQL